MDKTTQSRDVQVNCNADNIQTLASPMPQSVLVAGGRGMVGAAIIRALKVAGVEQIFEPTHAELDYCNQAMVRQWFSEHRPECVMFAAARVGGIYANKTYPAQFIYDNLAMAVNSIQAAYENQVKRFLYLGSTCIYPRQAPQPMPENCLLTSALESTNEAYAIAKIAGLKMCQFYRQQYGVMFHSAMPTNLYGPGDNYHPENSHVLPALVRRIHEARELGAESVTIWGTGQPRREFLHVDDLAAALVHLIGLADPPDWVNVGTGTDISIAELAQTVAEVVGYRGKFVFDTTKPDGTLLKRTDISLIQSTGWSTKIDLARGLRQTYECFLKETQQLRRREV